MGEVASLQTDTEVVASGSIAEAVGIADQWIGDAGVILLSPAAPSFSQFTNWKERSAAFAAAVHRRLAAEPEVLDPSTTE